MRTGLVVGCHTELVTGLGFKGMSDLLKMFHYVRTRGNERVGISATHQFQDSAETPIRLPGPYRPGAPALPAPPMRAIGEPEMSEVERKVLAYWDSTPESERTESQAGAAGYGERGGWQTTRAVEILRKYGRV